MAAIFLVLSFLLSTISPAGEGDLGTVPENLTGDWSLQIESGEAGWLSIRGADGKDPAEVRMFVDVGTARPKKGIRAGGEWQTYDITLVDRHITLVLNGPKVIDNQPVHGPTPGAMHTDPITPGPIYLQGDHSSVKYRNIVLRPLE